MNKGFDLHVQVEEGFGEDRYYKYLEYLKFIEELENDPSYEPSND